MSKLQYLDLSINYKSSEGIFLPKAISVSSCVAATGIKRGSNRNKSLSLFFLKKELFLINIQRFDGLRKAYYFSKNTKLLKTQSYFWDHSVQRRKHFSPQLNSYDNCSSPSVSSLYRPKNNVDAP